MKLPNNKHNRLLVFDIDGTLISSEHHLLPSTLTALQMARECGHQIVLASARPPASVVKIAAEITTDGLPAICLNGALIINTGDRKTIWEKPMSSDSVRSLIASGHEYGLYLSILANWEWLVEWDSNWSRSEAEIVQISPTIVGDFSTLPPQEVHKFLAVGDPSQTARYRQYVEESHIGVSATLSKPTYCEIVDQSVSKADSLAYLCKLCGIPLQSTIVFGDGDNDLQLLRIAGTGVAMGNASQALLAAADLVTSSNDQDGIALALVELGLIGDWRE